MPAQHGHQASGLSGQEWTEWHCVDASRKTSARNEPGKLPGWLWARATKTPQGRCWHPSTGTDPATHPGFRPRADILCGWSRTVVAQSASDRTTPPFLTSIPSIPSVSSASTAEDGSFVTSQAIVRSYLPPSSCLPGENLRWPSPSSIARASHTYPHAANYPRVSWPLALRRTGNGR